MKKETPIDVILHGEAMIFRSTLPSDAVEIKSSTPEYHIIADSETTGNHHVVDMVPGTKMFKSGTKTLFMNSAPTKVRCLHENRHDDIDLPAGTWEVDRQQEYDHFTQNLNAVRD